MSDPILVEVLRAGRVESFHRGAFAIVDADGIVVAHRGDVMRPVYPRSAVKALQALPLVESGAADRFGDAELALACASHSGEPEHVAVAAGMLRDRGLEDAHLACGAHWPMSTAASHDLAARGGRPMQLHNNCSGKHAGFLCLACHQGWETEGYVRPDHPVQEAVRDALSAMTGESLGADVRGIDGCSIPTYATPLRSLALAFARFGSGAHLEPTRVAAATRIRAACTAAPFYVAGTGRFDTAILTLFGDAVFLKTGAEGVYCCAVPALGLGIAIKMDDGAGRAAEVVVAELLAGFLPMTEEQAAALQPHRTPILTNWQGTEIGQLRASDVFAAAGR